MEIMQVRVDYVHMILSAVILLNLSSVKFVESISISNQSKVAVWDNGKGSIGEAKNAYFGT